MNVTGFRNQVAQEDGCIEVRPSKDEIETLKFLVNGQVDVRVLRGDADERLEGTG